MRVLTYVAFLAATRTTALNLSSEWWNSTSDHTVDSIHDCFEDAYEIVYNETFNHDLEDNFEA